MTNPKTEEPSRVTLSSTLSPADADKERDLVIGALDGAAGSEAPLGIDLDGEQLSPCALQLLIATTRSAKNRNVALDLSKTADTALKMLNQT